MAGTNVSIGANGRLLLFIMLVVLLSSFVVVVSSASSLAMADCGNVKTEIADDSDAAMYFLRPIIGSASLPCDGNAPSNDVVGLPPTPSSTSTFLVRPELEHVVGRWTHGTKPSDWPNNTRNECAKRIFFMLAVFLQRELSGKQGGNSQPTSNHLSAQSSPKQMKRQNWTRSTEGASSKAAKRKIRLGHFSNEGCEEKNRGAAAVLPGVVDTADHPKDTMAQRIDEVS